MTSPQKLAMQVSRWFSDVDWRVLILVILAPLSLLVFLSLSSSSPITAFSSSLPSFAPIKSLFYNRATPNPPAVQAQPILPSATRNRNKSGAKRSGKSELIGSRIAVCLVGGARRSSATPKSARSTISPPLEAPPALTAITTTTTTSTRIPRSGSLLVGGSRSRAFRDGFYASSASATAAPRKAAAVENTLPCSMEDLYKGAKNKMKISRMIAGYLLASARD